MPTGYTHKIADGMTFSQYLWGCARAMGALIMMRDDSADAPIPERFEPSDHYSETIAEYRAKLEVLGGLSPDAAMALYDSEMKKRREQESEITKESAELRNKYLEMLAQCRAWTPPSGDHVGLKDFMIEQIESSIRFDCHDPAFEAEPTFAQWLATEINETKRMLSNYEKYQREDSERVEARNRWLKQLRESVPQPEAAKK